MTLPSWLGYDMADAVVVVLFYILWIVHYSDALPICCKITTIQGESHVTCSGCRLLVIPQDLPTNTTVLDLSNNNLKGLKQGSFPQLLHLKKLNLQRNQLVRISSGAFDSVSNVEELDLSYNKLEHRSIDFSIFMSLKHLTTLKMYRNNFNLEKMYPGEVLSTLSNLRILFLDIFDGFDFNTGFSNLSQLQKLYLFATWSPGVSLNNTSFLGLKQTNITYLSIEGYIVYMEKNFLSPFTRLTDLNLKSWKRTIRDALRGLYGIRGRTMNSLSITDFRERFSRSVVLTKTDISYLGTICVKKLSLVGNAIFAISTNVVVSWKTKTCIEVLDISRNQFASGQFLSLLVLFSSLTHFYCLYTEHITTTVTRSAMISRRTTLFLPASLIYLQLAYNDISMTIENATIAKGNNLQVADISHSSGYIMCSNGLIKGLVHLQVLNISGFHCSEPNPDMFSFLPSLSQLVASKCHFGKILATNISLFKGLNNLSYLDISLNDIDRLHIDMLHDQSTSLKTLILAGNHMDRIPHDILKNLNALEWLDMSNNQMSTLTEYEYFLLDELRLKSDNFQIVLFGNPLVCNCDNLDFLSWISTTPVVYKKDELVCSTAEGRRMKIFEFLESFDQFKEHCVSQSWLIISVTLTVICFVSSILAREAWRRSVWLRIMCRHPKESSKYTNDIYISYCSKDSSWVKNTLAPWLDEKQIEFCCEDKDFILSRYKADNIMDAIDSSRQTVFVVSYASLEQEWTTFTVRLTYEYSLQVGREKMNIFILLDDIKKSEFPKLIRNSLTVIPPLRWPQECNTNMERMAGARNKFWGGLSRCILRRKSDFKKKHPHVTESIS
ncbi:toll-like receptor 8 [Argopecten irradians]|uniref:toll-like receptor 8 n=1 Tax=Argopecten irradians TaxID=31199 RepID=UPI0037206168